MWSQGEYIKEGSGLGSHLTRVNDDMLLSLPRFSFVMNCIESRNPIPRRTSIGILHTMRCNPTEITHPDDIGFSEEFFQQSPTFLEINVIPLDKNGFPPGTFMCPMCHGFMPLLSDCDVA